MTPSSASSTGPLVAIIGGGPAGLMAAQTLAGTGADVQLFDAMPSVGRKFLLAGKGGLNLSHGEPVAAFNTRFGERNAEVSAWLQDFGSAEVRAWAQGLGVDTFVGTSGRVFPTSLKAAPLLRAWLHRLRVAGVRFSMRHRWQGWAEDGALLFQTPAGPLQVKAQAVVLALGGGSWARLGSDGAWVSRLAERGVAVAPLRPSNCGFDVAPRPEAAGGVLASPGWSEHFASRFAGQPFKSVAIVVTDSQGRHFSRKGEFIATATGIEGSLVYAASAMLRDEIERQGSATLHVDLLPDRTPEQVLAEVRHPRGSRSWSSHLKSRLNLDGIKMGLLHELLPKSVWTDPLQLARAIKAVPLQLQAARPIDEAISSAGGVRLEGLTPHLQVQARVAGPPVFCAGEMLDWEAPTGGYLITACLASGRRAGQGALQHLGLTAAPDLQAT